MQQVVDSFRKEWQGVTLRVEPCVQCQGKMQCHNTADVSGGLGGQQYYLMVCNKCHFGPRTAYYSRKEAIIEWNRWVAEQETALLVC